MEQAREIGCGSYWTGLYKQWRSGKGEKQENTSRVGTWNGLRSAEVCKAVTCSK